MTTLNEQVLPPLVSALADTFGEEWRALSNPDQRLVLADYVQAAREGCVLPTYRGLIGAGNLQSYAKCLRVQS
jgi:hypothetical protein